MSKLRVHDMAGEFGITSDEVINLLRQMDLPVRSHLTLLTDDQVARIRARWEREKRVRAEKQTAPAPRRRRGTATAAPSTTAAPAPAASGESGVRRRRRPAEAAADTGAIATGDEADVDVAVPEAIETEPTLPNEIGMHRVAFSVDDIDAALEIAARHGCHPLRGVANYQDVYKLTYVRGPSGILVMLAQDLTAG